MSRSRMSLVGGGSVQRHAEGVGDRDRHLVAVR